MPCCPTLKRWLALGITAGMFVAILYIAGVGGPAPTAVSADDKDPAKSDVVAPRALDHLMFGGTPLRNMVNSAAKNLPVKFSVDEGSKDVKWAADLGSKAYGGPVIAGGKVIVGT